MKPLSSTWHLFGDVYVQNCYKFPYYDSTCKYYEYYHKCSKPLKVALIDKSGTCSNCNTHIAPYKSLETINGLLDIYS